MIEFKISNRKQLDSDTNVLYFISIICIIIKYLTNGSKKETPLAKLFIVYWAIESNYNLDLMLSAKSRNYETIPPYDVSPILNSMLIRAILNEFVIPEKKSSGLYLSLSKKGTALYNLIDSKKLFVTFQKSLALLGKIPNYIIDREVGLF